MIQVASPVCPECEQPADGIIESLLCRANLHKTDNTEKSIVLDYDGDSTMFWDSQEPYKSDKGLVTMCCTTCNKEWETTLLED